LREARKLAVEEINSDLHVIVCWCHIEYKPTKSSILMKQDREDRLMDGILIKEAETLSVLG